MMALMVVETCQQIEGVLPVELKMKMYSNIILDFLIGLVPLVGDLADGFFRANIRNAVLLEKYLCDHEARRLREGLETGSVPESRDPGQYYEPRRESDWLRGQIPVPRS